MNINSEMSIAFRNPEMASHLWNRFHQGAPLMKRIYPKNACRALFLEQAGDMPAAALPWHALKLVRPLL